MNEIGLVTIASLGLAGPGAILYIGAFEKVLAFESAFAKAPIVNVVFWLLWIIIHS
jgi:hypothetical protein